MNKFIYILPLREVNLDYFEKLEKDLENKFNFKVRLGNKVEIPDYAYSKDRNQYNGRIILNELDNIKIEGAEKILVITEVDLFADDLNFIFGQAESSGKMALISTKRLNPEFYKQKKGEDLFYKRIFKEAVHELGHTFGLKHCQNKKCVMHFSNKVEDTDVKEGVFCVECGKLYEYMKG